MRFTKYRSAAIAVAMFGSSLALMPATPAIAGTIDSQRPTTLAYTSSAHPGKSYMNPSEATDLPVGTAMVKKKDDTSRVYATFDLSSYLGKHIVEANLFSSEASETVCGTHAVDVWQTAAPGKKISWNNAPAEIAPVGSLLFGLGCPTSYVHLDVTALVTSAVAAGQRSLAIELRVPAGHEADPQYGITLDGGNAVTLDVNANATPTVPNDMSQDQFTCATSAPGPYLGDLQPTLRASSSDTDSNDTVTATFALWPVTAPSQRTLLTAPAFSTTGSAHANVPAGILADATTYAWQVQSSDGTDTSAWSPACYFTVDSTPPSAAPLVTSANFPAGQTAPQGVPGTFTFNPNGVSDIIGYTYHWGSPPGGTAYYIGDDGQPVFDPFAAPGVVHADADGSTTVTLSPPNFGIADLYVESIDKAYLVSSVTRYSFTMPQNAPDAVPSTSRPIVGVPITFALTANPAAGTVDSFQVQVNSGDVHTVAASPTGTGTYTITLTALGTTEIEIRSHSTNGLVSEAATIDEQIDGEPIIASTTYPEGVDGGGVGVNGTFDLTSTIPNVVSFTYSFDFGDEVTVAADSNGKAHIDWAPDTDGGHALSVYVTDASGATYNPYYYFFNVTGP